MFINLHKKGQSTLEYAVIIAVVVAALIAMQTYVKRGLQGRLKQASDDIGEQFSPGYSTMHKVTTSNVTSDEVVVGGDTPTTTTNSVQSQTSNVSESVGELSQEYYKE